MRKRVKRRIVQHDDDGEGNWLISYADLMTLLWGFFVILSAISVPNSEMLEKLRESTSESLGGEYEKPFNELTDSLQDLLKEVSLQEDAVLESISGGVKLTIKANDFFASGSSQLEPMAQDKLEKIAEVLTNSKEDFKIIVEGHTDDVPIQSLRFPSNWELSAFRAASVIRLFERIGIEHQRLSFVGHADLYPLVEIKNLSGEDLDEARSKNRRIVIKLMRKLKSRMSGVKEN